MSCAAWPADEVTTTRLTATLRTFLDERSSRSRTAKRLGIHENTVSYRIKQAEDVLGRSVDERSLELRVALELARFVGDRTRGRRRVARRVAFVGIAQLPGGARRESTSGGRGAD